MDNIRLAHMICNARKQDFEGYEHGITIVNHGIININACKEQQGKLFDID